MAAQQQAVRQDPDPEAAVFGGIFDDFSVRSKFIFKVYLLFWLQASFSFAVTLTAILIEDFRFYFIENKWLLYTILTTYLATLLCLMCVGKLRRKPPYNYVLWTIYSIALGFLLGIITSTYQLETVVIALGATWIICGSLMIFACITKRDLTTCYNLMFVLCVGIIIYIILMFVLKSRAVEIGFSCMVGVFFSFMLAVNTQRIMRNTTIPIEPDEYIYASILLYWDIFIILLCFLKICD